ncbi:hypothetical protein [Virgisporangium aliadipatigenens]|uniref:hypothetical protein n=1 Tax=Virgisporangium aliadipatigenens TaxID=741659 RepID=UPI0019421B06|nr:hypothetical protein [Virgisporangium aliadipatigenens]
MFRRRKLPADRKPPLARDERVVAWAGATGDDVVVATNHGLWLPAPDGPSRLRWHEIHKATWSGRALAIVPSEVVATHETYAVTADAPGRTVTLLDPDRVPEQVRARVTKSVAFTSHHPLPAGGGVRVVARRVPGRDGLSWAVRYDPDTAPDPETVAALVAQASGTITTGESVVPPG